MKVSALVAQEWECMKDEKCPRCNQKLRGRLYHYRGFGGGRFKWRCINPECDQFKIPKTDTQIAANHIVS